MKDGQIDGECIQSRSKSVSTNSGNYRRNRRDIITAVEEERLTVLCKIVMSLEIRENFHKS